MSSSPGKKKVAGPTNASDVIVGTLLQAARKYLFIPTQKKALAYVVIVLLVSLFATYYPPSEGYYLASKQNIFNRYGTKAGWFWTIVTVGPFIWLTSFLHHQNHSEALRHLSRLLVATGFWYFVTHTYLHVEKITGRCVHHAEEGKAPWDRDQCSLKGGKWAPGIDISGHAFLLVYNVLIICEEAVSFMNWPNTLKRQNRIATVQESNNFEKCTRSVQWLFIILFVFHIFWDFQLIITCLFYHDVSHKVIGAVTAVACWALTYRFWYPLAFPGLPVKRKFKSF